MTDTIKLWSVERAFSNATKKFLSMNYDVEFKQEGWKHGKPLTPDEMDHVDGMVMCVKNPYAHIVSYFKGWKKGHLLSDHYQNNPDDILSTHVDKMPSINQTLKTNPIHKDKEFIETWCEKYNTRMNQYLEIAQDYDNAIIVRHEDFLENEEQTLKIIGDKLGLEQKNDEIILTDREIGTQGEKSNSFDKSYYTDHRYMNDITETQKTILESQIDWDLVNKFKYGKMDQSLSSAPNSTDGKIRLIYYGDWNKFTGFGRVSRNILMNLPKDDFEIRVLGINFESHNASEDLPENIRAYPASYKQNNGGPYGIEETLKYFSNTDFDYDIGFVLQDSFIMSQSLGQRQGEKVSFIARLNEVAKSRSASTCMYFPIDTPTPDKRWLSPVLGHVDKPVTYTNWAKDVIENEVNNSNLTDDLGVVYHGTNPESFYPANNYDRNQVLNEFGLNDSEFNLMFLGANQRRKDIPRSVIGAYCRLYQEYPNTNLWLKTHRDGGSDGHHLPTVINQLTSEFNVPKDKINFVGDRDGYIPKEYINILYNMADSLILPSLEGWGLPVTECYTARTPTIVGDHGSLGEIGQDNRSVVVNVPDDLDHKTWFTLDNNVQRTHIDLDDFVNKAGKLIEGKSDVDIDKAYRWANDLKWENQAEKWEEVFRGLI